MMTTIHIAGFTFQIVADHWNEALDAVRTGNGKGRHTTGKGKGNGKAKGKKFDTAAGEYPFDYKLASVLDWRYDEGLSKKKTSDDGLDS